jgi:Tol biopolymer transport system component
LNELAELQNQNEPTAQDRRRALLGDLAEQLSAYADRLQAESRVCDAVSMVENAIQIAVSETLEERQSELIRECADLTAVDAIVEIGGTILYSSGGEGTAYNIWRLPVNSNAISTMQSSLVVANAAQPQLSPNGSVLAYYSYQAGQDGLYGVNTGGFTSLGGAVRYGLNPEDSRDSPPSWDFSGSQIAYSTSRGNQAAHIYVAPAVANSAGRDLGFGKDPAWRPGYDLLVFNGPDMAGQGPGLRAMSASGDGSDRYALTGTLNGNDQRPSWSPDGNFVVFMSKDREGGDSWEVYRLNWQSGEIILLTDGNPSQDGLPAVSPDGKWVVFMSDRGGRWKLWYVSIEGGPVHYLSDISGQPLAWLEHSLQWVR